MEKPTHKISACYFPGKGEVELTWENLETGERAELTTKVSKGIGERISKTVMACVYHEATVDLPRQRKINASTGIHSADCECRNCPLKPA